MRRYDFKRQTRWMPHQLYGEMRAQSWGWITVKDRDELQKYLDLATMSQQAPSKKIGQNGKNADFDGGGGTAGADVGIQDALWQTLIMRPDLNIFAG